MEKRTAYRVGLMRGRVNIDNFYFWQTIPLILGVNGTLSVLAAMPKVHYTKKK